MAMIQGGSVADNWRSRVMLSGRSLCDLLTGLDFIAPKAHCLFMTEW